MPPTPVESQQAENPWCRECLLGPGMDAALKDLQGKEVLGTEQSMLKGQEGLSDSSLSMVNLVCHTGKLEQTCQIFVYCFLKIVNLLLFPVMGRSTGVDGCTV